MITTDSLTADLKFYTERRKQLNAELRNLPTGHLYYKNINGYQRPYVREGGKEKYLNRKLSRRIVGLKKREIIEACIQSLDKNIDALKSAMPLITDFSDISRMLASLHEISAECNADTISKAGASSPSDTMAVAGASSSPDAMAVAGASSPPDAMAAAGASSPPDALATAWASSSAERQRWLDVECGRPGFEGSHKASDGTALKSRVELVLYEYFMSQYTTVMYERPLNIQGELWYPDFSFFRAGDGATILWEHLGMMNDPDYCAKALYKIFRYSEAGFLPYRNIVYTYDFGHDNIDLQYAAELLRYMKLL